MLSNFSTSAGSTLVSIICHWMQVCALPAILPATAYGGVGSAAWFRRGHRDGIRLGQVIALVQIEIQVSATRKLLGGLDLFGEQLHIVLPQFPHVFGKD